MSDRAKIFLDGLDDLFGALGGFSFYMSASGHIIPSTRDVLEGKVKKTIVTEYTVEITHICIYVRDTYDFIGGQYLGHWNKNGVEVAISAVMDDRFGGMEASDFQPSGDPPDVKLPVGNWSYNNYRKKHNKGGDLLIFSDMRILTLKKPMRYSVLPHLIEHI